MKFFHYKKMMFLLIITINICFYSCFPEDEYLYDIYQSTETDFTVTITSDSLQRQFRVHLPPAAITSTQILPAVIVFHGAGDTAHDFQFWTRFDSIADSLGFIMIYPYSFAYYWVEDIIDSPEGVELDDIIFSADIINYGIENLNFDADNIFIAGYSSGGLFAHRMASDLKDHVAAYATYGATMSSVTYTKCTEANNVPVMMMIGTNDEAIPWNGSNPNSINFNPDYYYMSQDQTLERVLLHNNCSITDSTITYINENPDFIVVRIEKFHNSANEVLVENYKIIGALHRWYYGDIIPEKEMLHFFARFTGR
ncbi:alpha/beta hydrolase family esterase [candidate division KSB1 bacterium]